MPVQDPVYRLPLPSFDKPVKLLIVVARNDKEVSDALVAGALAKVAAAGALSETLDVPGLREVPQAVALAERLAEFDGYVALGCILGDAGNEVSRDVSRALMSMGLGGACSGHGILNMADRAQALAAADPSGQDKGGEAAAAALHLIAISRKWAGQTKGIGFRA